MTFEDLVKYEEMSRASNVELVKQILQHLPQDGVFIDVGSNVGGVSLPVLEAVHCKAILFEPVSELRAYCSQKIGSLATLEGFALGEGQEERTLYLGFASTNYGWNTFVTEKTTPDMQGIVVPIISLDEYLESHPIDRLDVIKIDVEGYEYKTLKGMQKTLSRFHPVIFLEIGWGTSHPYWKEEVEVFEWLIANGYKRFDYNVDKSSDVVILPG